MWIQNTLHVFNYINCISLECEIIMFLIYTFLTKNKRNLFPSRECGQAQAKGTSIYGDNYINIDINICPSFVKQSTSRSIGQEHNILFTACAL